MARVLLSGFLTGLQTIVNWRPQRDSNPRRRRESAGIIAVESHLNHCSLNQLFNFVKQLTPRFARFFMNRSRRGVFVSG